MFINQYYIDSSFIFCNNNNLDVLQISDVNLLATLKIHQNIAELVAQNDKMWFVLGMYPYKKMPNLRNN